jgi:hypothetical protein
VNTCLVWRDPVDDFELRLRFRLLDVITAEPANSGILYRARRLDEWRVQGYQCDLHAPHVGTLLLLWDTDSDPRSELGRSATLQDINGRTVVCPLAKRDGDAGISSPFVKEDWNELVIVAQGNQPIHSVNGIQTAEVREESPSARLFSGCLALELKRATAVQFKGIRLNHLSTVPARQPPPEISTDPRRPGKE